MGIMYVKLIMLICYMIQSVIQSRHYFLVLFSFLLFIEVSLSSVGQLTLDIFL